MVIQDMDKCTKSPTGEHVWNYAPRPDNCRLGTCRYCEQQRVFEGALTHTAALKTAPVKPETMEKAVVIAEKSLIRKVTEPAPAGRKSNMGGWKLSAEMIEDIKKRLKAGEAVSVLAVEYSVTKEAIYPYRRQMGIHGKNGKKSGPAATCVSAQVKPEASIRNVDECVEISKAQKDTPESQPADPKSNGHKPEFNYASRKGNIMSQMGRLGRGQVKVESAHLVLESYRDLLDYELKMAQKEVRDIKHKRDLTDEALNGLEKIKSGQKDIIEKTLAAVR